MGAAGPYSTGSGMARGDRGLPRRIGPSWRTAPSKLGWHPPSALRCHPKDAGMLLGLLSCCRSRTTVGCSQRWRGMLGGAIQRSQGKDGAGVHCNAKQGYFIRCSTRGGLSSLCHACKIISTNLHLSSFFFFFFIANQKQPKLQSRVQVGLSGELASFTSLFAGLKIYMLKLGVFFFFFLILGLRRRL